MVPLLASDPTEVKLTANGVVPDAGFACITAVGGRAEVVVVVVVVGPLGTLGSGHAVATRASPPNMIAATADFLLMYLPFVAASVTIVT